VVLIKQSVVEGEAQTLGGGRAPLPYPPTHVGYGPGDRRKGTPKYVKHLTSSCCFRGGDGKGGGDCPGGALVWGRMSYATLITFI